jgi:hypothetical protein
MTPAQISGVRIPDSKIAREVTQLIRDTESHLLFHHSVRVFFCSQRDMRRRCGHYDFPALKSSRFMGGIVRIL